MSSELAVLVIVMFSFMFIISASIVGWLLVGNPFIGIAGFALGVCAISILSVTRVASG